MKTAKRATLIFLLGILLSTGGPASAFEIPPVTIHGFLSQGYLKSTENDFLSVSTEDGTFSFTEMGVNFSAQMTEKLRLGLQLFSRDFGPEGNFDVILDWAIGEYHWRDWLGLRFGKVKLPVGFYNQGRDVDMLRTSIFLPQAIYHERLRDMMNAFVGGELYGNLPLSVCGDLDYELYGGTLDLDDSIILKNFILRGASQGMPSGSRVSLTDLDVEVEYLAGGALRWNTPLNNLRLGFSILTTKSDMNADLITSIPFVPQMAVLQMTSQLPVDVEMTVNYSYVASAEFSLWDLTVTGEYFYQNSDIRTNLDLGIPGVPSLMEIEQNHTGYYGQIAYRFCSWFEASTYYCEYYPIADDRSGDSYAAKGQPNFLAWHKDLALSLRFDITSYWLIKLEGHFIDGAASLERAGEAEDAERRWGLFAVKTTFNF